MKKHFFMAFLLAFAFLLHLQEASAVTQSRENYEKTGRVIWEVDTDQKLVSLTFDDGPHPEITPQILDILAKYNAKATFFIAGNKAVRFPDLVKREIAEGHEIANHTYNHPYKRDISADHLRSELEQTDKVLKDITGYLPNLYRPVGGLYNDRIIDTAIKNGKTIILWSWDQDSRDWTNPPAARMSKYIIKGLEPGSIILFHDWTEFTNNNQTVIALETILKYLQDEGYRSVTVSELIYQSSIMIKEDIGIYP